MKQSSSENKNKAHRTISKKQTQKTDKSNDINFIIRSVKREEESTDKDKEQKITMQIRVAT